MSDYQEELVMSLSSAREIAAQSIRCAQKKYKKTYDKKSAEQPYRVGEWVLVKFTADWEDEEAVPAMARTIPSDQD